MKILICGAGKGSWEMRGLQLGAALGARVTSAPTDSDFQWADVVVLVKKHAIAFAPRAHKAGKPIVWDALDFWSQPSHNNYKEPAAQLALQIQIKVIKPALVIGATEAMTAAARNFCAAAYLPHHSWAGLAPTAPRDAVAVVGYQGNPSYLGRWHRWISDACAARGWTFVVNPIDLAATDILVSFRDGPWDGWICREWKSGVKAINAIAAGRPLISQDSAAVRELRPIGRVIEQHDDLDGAFDAFTPVIARQEAEAFDRSIRADDLTVDKVAVRYLDILSTVGASCASA